MESFINSAINSAIAEGNKTMTHNDNDFFTDDGLLMCGNCKSPKQIRLKFLGEEKIFPCICKCEEKIRKAEEIAKKEFLKEFRIKQKKLDGITDKAYRQWTFDKDDGKDEKTSKICHKYAENFTKFRKDGLGLLLYGHPGTGKTFSACCIANELADRGISVLVTNFSKILNALTNIQDRKEYLNSLCSYSLLVLDDLGIERRTEYANEQVYNIIDSRYKSNLPMIITTNLTIEEIKSPKDIEFQRIYSRILEKCHPVQVNAKNRRVGKIIENFEEMKKILEG